MTTTGIEMRTSCPRRSLLGFNTSRTLALVLSARCALAAKPEIPAQPLNELESPLSQVILAKAPKWGLVALKRTFDPSLELSAGHRLATDTAGEAAALQATAHRHVVPLLGVVQQV